MLFKASERQSFSTDYMEWNLRSSVRLRRAPGAHDDREQEQRSLTTTSRRTTRPRSRPSSLPHRTGRSGQSRQLPFSKSWPLQLALVEKHGAREDREGPAARPQGRTGGLPDTSRQGVGPRRRGRSQGGAIRARRLSSDHSTSIRQRARLRRRRGSTWQRTGRLLMQSRARSRESSVGPDC